MRDPNPRVPWSPEEIARDAAACRDAGASIVHYHARDPETGAASSDLSLYEDAARSIRARCDAIVMPTLGASTVTLLDARIGHIDGHHHQRPAHQADHHVPVVEVACPGRALHQGANLAGLDRQGHYRGSGCCRGNACRQQPSLPRQERRPPQPAIVASGEDFDGVSLSRSGDLEEAPGYFVPVVDRVARTPRGTADDHGPFERCDGDRPPPMHIDLLQEVAVPERHPTSVGRKERPQGALGVRNRLD